jgi:hypothetical protein
VTSTSTGTTGPQPGSPRTRRTRTRSTRKETTVNAYDPATAVIVEPVITGAYVQRAATLNECTVAAAGILASADAAGLPLPSSVTVYGWSPEINLLISGETPAETWANLEAWAVRHGSQGITVQPSAGGGDRAYATAEFTASGIRVILAAIIKGDPGNAMDIDPDTESATMPDATDTDATADNTP